MRRNMYAEEYVCGGICMRRNMYVKEYACEGRYSGVSKLGCRRRYM